MPSCLRGRSWAIGVELPVNIVAIGKVNFVVRGFIAKVQSLVRLKSVCPTIIVEKKVSLAQAMVPSVATRFVAWVIQVNVRRLVPSMKL